MGEFYSTNQSRHESPTRRLMQMKEATVKHKDAMRTNDHRTQAYGLTYCTSPDKAYVIEPKGGEIDYRLAYKKPLAFYDKVMNQEIT